MSVAVSVSGYVYRPPPQSLELSRQRIPLATRSFCVRLPVGSRLGSSVPTQDTSVGPRPIDARVVCVLGKEIEAHAMCVTKHQALGAGARARRTGRSRARAWASLRSRSHLSRAWLAVQSPPGMRSTA